MPWDAASFHQHNHSLSPEQSAHAARIANAILGRGAGEGVAIATANKPAVHPAHHDAGGQVDPTQDGGLGGLAPSIQSMNPTMRGLVQRYSSMPVEKLQELASAFGGTPQGQVVNMLLQQKRIQPNAQPQTPAAQPAMQQRGGMVKRAGGGETSPWWEKSEARGEVSGGGGFLAGTTPGRADAVRTTSPAGSYIVPADVVAGLGEGNSLSGARVLQEIMSSGPWGTPLGRPGPSRALPHPEATQPQARGGTTQPTAQSVPVLLSHGEFSVTPEQVMRIGKGNLKRGHAILDAWIVKERAKQIAKLKSLPGPVKSR